MANEKSPSIIVIDVNETLLDITTLEPRFYRVFVDRAVLSVWCAQRSLYSQAMTLAGRTTPLACASV